MALSVTSAVAKTISATIASASAAATSGNKATPQGGILEGGNPSTYDPKNPIILFIIQAGIIIIFCRLLHYPLSRLRQPRVIAEVLGGIILGPSVMMRIPGFENAIFPPGAPLAGLTLVANLGLIFFLFLVGLEVDMRMFQQHWKIALSVGLAGMALPFGLGAAISWGIYNQFKDDKGTVPVSFGVYMLFIAVALSITAFPVLCRILTELKLLATPVGVTVLAAGVGNDVMGWILLALCVALVNNGSGITALWVLLTVIAWILFLVFIVRPCFLWLLKRNGSIQNGPSQGIVALTLLIALISAWFTGIIGVHPIFGAFLAGLICPHDGGFAIKITEKIEDIVATIFLPLYFALSGLSTDLGLLNDSITWAYIIGIIAIAFSGKIIGGTLAARANRLYWRESFTIGVLMSCKGLVELIVLNIGLQAKILSTRTFTMFVVMALVTTVSTTPLTTALYPPWYQKKLAAFKRGEIDWDGNNLMSDGSEGDSLEKLRSTQVRRLLVYLRLDSLSSVFTFITLLNGETSPAITKIHRSKSALGIVSEEKTASPITSSRPLNVHGVRILELTDRTSSVMKVSEVDEYSRRDPVVNVFRTFSQLNNVSASGGVSIVPESSYAETIISTASDVSSDLILIPWSETGNINEGNQTLPSDSSSDTERFSNHSHNSFIQEVLDKAACNTAIFIDRGFGGPTIKELSPPSLALHSFDGRRSHEVNASPISDRTHHIFFPFFSGPDDRIALRFVLQLAQNTNVTATIAHIRTPHPQLNSRSHSSPQKSPEVTTSSHPTTKTQSILQRIVSAGSSHSPASQIHVSHPDAENTEKSIRQDTAFLHALRDSLPDALLDRVVFLEKETETPVAACLDMARMEVGLYQRNAGDLVVVGRGGDVDSFIREEKEDGNANGELRRCLGVVGESIVSGGVGGSVLVVRGGMRGRDS